MEKASAAWPETKAQLRSHCAAGSGAGVNWRVPPNESVWCGRARPQLSFSTVLAISPGPSAVAAATNTSALRSRRHSGRPISASHTAPIATTRAMMRVIQGTAFSTETSGAQWASGNPSPGT
jgi:hypothetical protein